MCIRDSLSTNAVKSPISATFSPSGTPREGAFNVNGMRSTYNNFLLDGLDNNAYGTSNQGYSAQLVQLSPDALAEFKVITSNYSAEYGRVGGAVVNAVMKSGTNELHGSAYEYVRNTDLNATGFLFSPCLLYTSHRAKWGGLHGPDGYAPPWVSTASPRRPRSRGFRCPEYTGKARDLPW